MHWIVLTIILALVGGIIYFSRQTHPSLEGQRELFLQRVEREFETKRISIVQKENSFRIRFKFEGENFDLEDIEEQGFSHKHYKVWLKATTPSRLNLSFSEKLKDPVIGTPMVIASELREQESDKRIHVRNPKELDGLEIHTDDPIQTNKLFDDPKIVKIFSEFKNADSRGYPFMSLRILDGTLILEFHSTGSFRPNLNALRNDVASLEDYLNKLLSVVKVLNRIAT